MDLLIRRGGEKGKYGDRKEIYKRDTEWGRGSLLFNYWVKYFVLETEYTCDL